ncbi:hypothetical protein PHLCEN_2v5920 [Hermanssonia centrifuga]|uniref:Oligopeptide transporter n=1 Tax=Hermanssonia centrifuga TaxID=98765 RepID=A0A2R6P0U6_9APHY|nr:hypothetical protein PHLCEN_2v5920 [Hermanssonia centrifuga]
MSYPNTPPSPSPEPPKAPYEFDVAKWEHQQMAENGGNERTSYLALDPLGTHDSSPALVSIVDQDIYDDPNIDLDAEYLEDESPYPEVRSAVANTDDPDMPAGTLRAWILGLVWAIIIPGVNQFYFFRFPNITVGSLVAQLLSFPLGRLLARVIPRRRIWGIPLNPGPFSIKEHVVVTIMAGVGASSAYATDIIAVQRFQYNQIYSFGYQFMVVMSTQLIGFSIGGIAKRFLVSPPSMIWPSNLVYCALFNTLHAQWYVGMGKRGGISRERFFVYAFTAATLWFVIPGYLFTALSFFSWVCWIKPHNIVVNQLFGYQSGLGMSLITFDWSQIAFIGSPLATPWWAEGNVAFGFVFFFWFITPLLYYTNVWDAQYLPMLSRSAYNNTGQLYEVDRVLTNSTFDMKKYKEYSPLFLPMAFVMSYALSFASVTGNYSPKSTVDIMVQARRSLAEQPDIHARLMSQYPQVPEWWYICIFAIMFVFGVVSIEIYPTEMPVWAFCLALAIAFVYTIPIGIIQAVTNQQIGLNVIAELVAGYARPGRPLAMMLFKTWGYVVRLVVLTVLFQ